MLSISIRYRGKLSYAMQALSPMLGSNSCQAETALSQVLGHDGASRHTLLGKMLGHNGARAQNHSATALAFANAVALLYTVCSFEKIMEATLSQ